MSEDIAKEITFRRRSDNLDIRVAVLEAQHEVIVQDMHEMKDSIRDLRLDIKQMVSDSAAAMQKNFWAVVVATVMVLGGIVGTYVVEHLK